MSVFIIRALLFRFYFGAPDFGKHPYSHKADLLFGAAHGVGRSQGSGGG